MKDLLDEPKRPWGRYVTPTMLKGYLAGDDKCFFKLWFMGNYDFEKRAEDPESLKRLAEWNRDHDAMVAAKKVELESDGFKVKLEHQMKIKGRHATLSGRLDILALKDEFVHVWDCKTGKKRDADKEQVRIYVHGLPLTDAFNHPLFPGSENEIQGFVEYRDGSVVDVFPDVEKRDLMSELIASVDTANAPSLTPSRFECMRCKIANCPEREEDLEGDSGGMF